jgi:anaerobic magnesium-protoporphyrin IX monomethyl ester cyclase
LILKIFFLFYEDPENPTSFPLGVGILSSILKKNGHTVKGTYIHNSLSQDVLKEIFDSVTLFGPDLLAFSCTSPAFKNIAVIGQYLRGKCNIPTICGGAHPTLYPQETLASKGIDYVCVGDGEISFIEFVQCLEKGRGCEKNIPGIFYLDKAGKLIEKKLYPMVQDLDSLAWIDYDVFGKQYIQKETADGWLRFITSRGCPYNCSYCHTPMFRKVYSERLGVPESRMGYVRLRSVDSLLAELKDIVQKYDLKVINFMDDLFCLKRSRTLEFCEKFKRQLPGHVGYSIQTHLAHLDEEIVTALSDSRCLRVVVGVESGSQRVLDLFNRKTSPAKMKDKLELLVKARFSLGTWSLNILGNPGETVAEMLQTVAINAQLLVERIKFNILAPYPQSKIYDYCVEHGFFINNTASQDFKDRSISRLKFPLRESAFLEKFLDIGHWYFNVAAPLNLEDYYRPLIDEVEQIGPGDWATARPYYMNLDKKITETCKKNDLPFYDFVLKGKVYSIVIGLNMP